MVALASSARATLATSAWYANLVSIQFITAHPSHFCPLPCPRRITHTFQYYGTFGTTFSQHGLGMRWGSNAGLLENIRIVGVSTAVVRSQFILGSESYLGSTQQCFWFLGA